MEKCGCCSIFRHADGVCVRWMLLQLLLLDIMLRKRREILWMTREKERERERERARESAWPGARATGSFKFDCALALADSLHILAGNTSGNDFWNFPLCVWKLTDNTRKNKQLKMNKILSLYFWLGKLQTIACFFFIFFTEKSRKICSHRMEIESLILQWITASDDWNVFNVHACATHTHTQNIQRAHTVRHLVDGCMPFAYYVCDTSISSCYSFVHVEAPAIYSMAELVPRQRHTRSHPVRLILPFGGEWTFCVWRPPVALWI